MAANSGAGGYAQAQAQEGSFGHVFTKQNKAGKTITDDWIFSKEVLGEGSYGTCRTAFRKEEKDSKNKSYRCVKEIDRKKVKDPARFQKELDIQEVLDHPNIVKVFETYQDFKNYYLVMEKCEGGELFDRIIDASEASATGMAFDEKMASTYMQQIFGAMQYLHSKNFAHRDIKPENFLMSTKGPEAKIKVIDFGLAATFKSGVPMTTKAGTPYYVAPEVLKGKYNETCDVWSCGCILYILLSGVPPFYGETDPEILAAVKKGSFEYGEEWTAAEISAQAKDLINKMLVFQDKRPPFKDLMEHVWLTDHAAKKQVNLSKTIGSSLKKYTTNGTFKKLALTCIAQQLSDNDIKELRTTFESLDENNDGSLTIKEIMNGMKAKGMEISEEVLKKIDTDSSGVIDYTEFIAATMERTAYESEAKMWAAFRTLDLDGDGKISRSEIATAIGDPNHNHGEPSPLLQKMMDEVDEDGDGEITFEEFKKAVKK